MDGPTFDWISPSKRKIAPSFVATTKQSEASQVIEVDDFPDDFTFDSAQTSFTKTLLSYT